jgi:two-component system, OmpR family, phosphate regulon response regulator PhoB
VKLQSPPAVQALATVLVADDEPSMRLLVRTTIESAAYNVFEAADGDEAWAFIQQHRPALVLLDIQMSGLNGLEILQSIKNDPGLSQTRVILLTAKALASDVAAGMNAGADFYLTKPFSPLELLNRVIDVLRL